MRLRVRRTRVWSSSYLVYRYLWPNLEAAAREATESRAASSRYVLDVGCGQKPYSDMFPGFTYIGVNNSLEDASPDIVANAECLPLASQSFDVVLCTQVLEHVPRPGRLLGECRRVLRPEGWLLLSAPFYWPIHEEPFDFFRFTKYGLERLLLDAGFSDVRIRPDGGDHARLFLSILQALPRWLEILVRIPLNFLGTIFDTIPHEPVLPANYTVVARVPR